MPDQCSAAHLDGSDVVSLHLFDFVSSADDFDGVRFLSNVKSNNPLHIDTTLDVVDPISTSGYIKLVSQAGAAAGSTAVTGAVATSVLLAVFASNDTTHAVTNVTAEWVANPATAGHFDNTGGADNTGSHVLFVFYNPPADVEHILP